jgi:hypothetical protein
MQVFVTTRVVMESCSTLLQQTGASVSHTHQRATLAHSHRVQTVATAGGTLSSGMYKRSGGCPAHGPGCGLTRSASVQQDPTRRTSPMSLQLSAVQKANKVRLSTATFEDPSDTLTDKL